MRASDGARSVNTVVPDSALLAYCANLGHPTDAETGLVYMRGRYYEPWTGRFLSEDPALDGTNWFVYCGNDPVGRVDSSGQSAKSELYALLGDVFKIVGLALMVGGAITAWVNRTALQTFVAKIKEDYSGVKGLLNELGGKNTSTIVDLSIFVIQALLYTAEGGRVCGLSTGVVWGYAGYTLMLWGYLLCTEADFLDPHAANEGLAGWL
jgi:RHS repeat-associated protein